MSRNKIVPLLFLFALTNLSLGQVAGGSQVPTQVPVRLTLSQAEQLALKNNPTISVARLLSLAQGEVTREVRATELPLVAGNLTAVEPNQGSRISAGALNNPVLYQRAAGGITLAQLITDFGRSRNLTASAEFRDRAAVAQQQSTAAEITLAVDQAFYDALAAQASLKVAQQTVASRQTTADQVQALTNARLKSDLDLSFANVNLAQAKLLLLNAQNRRAETLATLNALLGNQQQQNYELVDETSGAPPAPPASSADLLAMALRMRPDLAALRYESEAAERFRRAEHDLQRPAISALGVVGGAPVRSDPISLWYGAVGVNLSIPLFTGFAYSARGAEADYRASAAREKVRELVTRIARDVQITYLQEVSAYQRLDVTRQLLQQASMALDLAQTRYNLGLGSIVELSQAQLQQTQAAIDDANARYQYESLRAAMRFQTGQ